MNTVRVCASCTKINAGVEDLESFHRAVEAELLQLKPDLVWQVEKAPCFKVCPIGKLTMTVTVPSLKLQDRLTVSREPTASSVAKEALSFLKDQK